MRRSDARKTGNTESVGFWWGRLAALLCEYLRARMDGSEARAESVERRLRDAARRWARRVGSGMERGAESVMLSYLESCESVCDAIAADDAELLETAGDLLNRSAESIAELMSAAIENFPGETLRLRLAAHTDAFLDAVGHRADGDDEAYAAKESERTDAARQVGLLLDEWAP